MAGDTRGSDTVHTRYARKGTPTAMHAGQRMPSLELSHQGRRGQPGRSRPGKPPLAHATHTGKLPVAHSTHIHSIYAVYI